MPRPFAPVAIVLALLAAGCQQQTREVTRYASNLVTAGGDEEIAAEYVPIVRSAFGGLANEPSLDQYLNRVLRALIGPTEFAGPDTRIFLLNTGAVRAVSVPGGQIFLSRGLVGLMSSEAEIAGIIAHELAQLELGHARTPYLADRADHAIAQAIAQLPMNSQIAQAATLLRQPFLTPYSAADVEDADRIAARLLASAGYDPQALTSAVAIMEAYEAATKSAVAYFESHPRSEDGVAFALTQVELPPTARAVDRELYLQNIDGLVIDDDPRTGVILDGAFISLGRDIEFEVPEGFSVFGGDGPIVGNDGDKAAFLFDIDVPISIPNNLRLYMQDGFARALTLREIDSIVVNNKPGATGRATLRTRAGEVDVRVAVVKLDSRRVGRFVFLSVGSSTALYAPKFRRTLFSLDAAPGENALPQALTVEVVNAAAGDTVGGLSARMDVTGDKEAAFRAINGFLAGQGIVPGAPVKLFVR